DHQQALGADRERQQVQARTVRRTAAQFERLSFHGVAADAEHVVHRQAVLEAVNPAGVFRYVAADGTGDLGGGVGRVVQAMHGSTTTPGSWRNTVSPSHS